MKGGSPAGAPVDPELTVEGLYNGLAFFAICRVGVMLIRPIPERGGCYDGPLVKT